MAEKWLCPMGLFTYKFDSGVFCFQAKKKE
jgi:hypothetical protein